MAKASLLPQALTPTYKNLSPIVQEISSEEMSEVTKKVTTPQARCGSLGGSLIHIIHTHTPGATVATLPLQVVTRQVL